MGEDPGSEEDLKGRIACHMVFVAVCVNDQI